MEFSVLASTFGLVFIGEIGDKTQIATLAIAVENISYLLIVFLGSASTLVSVTALTILFATHIPTTFVPFVQRLGAIGMIGYGLYMILF